MKIIFNNDKQEKKRTINKSKLVLYPILIVIFFVLGVWSERYDARLYLQKSFKEFVEFSSIKILFKTLLIGSSSSMIKIFFIK